MNKVKLTSCIIVLLMVASFFVSCAGIKIIVPGSERTSRVTDEPSDTHSSTNEGTTADIIVHSTAPDDGNTTVPNDGTTQPSETTIDPNEATSAIPEVTTKPNEPHSHVPVIDPAAAPDCLRPGLSEGSHCMTCGEILVKQLPIPALGHKYNNASDTICSVCGAPAVRLYGYTQLGTLAKGSAMQSFYNKISEVSSTFHANTAKNIAADGIIEKLKYSDVGLSLDEALAVLASFRNDNPQYYWFASTVSHTSTELYIMADESYFSGAVRAEINALIEATILNTVINETDPYGITLYIHDMITERMTYAYEPDGVTPSNDISAHNIVGYFKDGRGVCEAYAKAFQLYLNRFGVENIIVSGIGNGGPHAWNLVRMNDGNWYWFDVTWDDAEKFPGGKIYSYFCVNDTELRSWNGGGWDIGEGSAFTYSHSHTVSSKYDLNYLYELPARSAVSFSDISVPTIGSVFTDNGMTYTIVGYDEAELNNIEAAGSVVIPQSVSFLGSTFSTVSVGKVENGYISAVCGNELTEITLPSGIRSFKFVNSHGLKTVNLPATLPAISANAFFGCPALETINFAGNVSEWQALEKGSNWDLYTGNYTVVCSNGTITKN